MHLIFLYNDAFNCDEKPFFAIDNLKIDCQAS